MVVVLPIAWTVLLAFQDAKLVDIQGMGLFGNWSLDNFGDVFASAELLVEPEDHLHLHRGQHRRSVLLGLVAALALRKPFRGRGLLRAAMLLPYVAPVVAVAFVWEVALSPQYGVVNDWGRRLFGWDDPIAFLSTREYEVSLLGAHFDIRSRCSPSSPSSAGGTSPSPSCSSSPGSRPCPPCWRRPRPSTGPLRSSASGTSCSPAHAGDRAAVRAAVHHDLQQVRRRLPADRRRRRTDVAAVRVYDFLTARYDVGAAAAQALVLAASLMILLGFYFKFFGNKVQEEA